RPYETNRLRIEPTDLPLTARIDDTALRITPYHRSGAIAKFEITTGASALARAVAPDGRPVPEGARARVGAGDFVFPVGIDGRLYIETVRAGAQVEVMYGGTRCAFTVTGQMAVPDA